MSGGIVQLVATGAQDTWLTGKPEISFFRSNYKRYTHYALSSERQIIQGNPSAGSISTIRFEKKGDLLSYVYFIGKDTSGALIPGVDWSKVVDKIELLIGGQVVDTQDITWMTQIEPVTGAQNYSQRYLNNDLTGLTNVINGFLPLKFFFCKDWSVALPLVALQYHDVELRITWSQGLNYRVNYELYAFQGTKSVQATGITASTTPIIGSQVASIALGGATSASVTNPVITMSQFAATISNPLGLSATSNSQANVFQYACANCAIYPGLGFTIGSNTMTVLSVSASNTSAGTFTAYSSGPPQTTALAPTSTVFTSNAYLPTQWTGTVFALVAGTNSFTGTLTKSGTLVSNLLPINSVISTGAPTGASYWYISAASFAAGVDTVATVTITGGGTIGTLPAATAFNTNLTFTPWYPIINLGIGAATGSIASGQTIVGQASLTATATPQTVNTVYNTGVISINNLTVPGNLGGGGVGDTVANVNTALSGVGLQYIPGKYVVATSNGATGTFNTTPAATAFALSNYVSNGTLTTTPALAPGSSLLFFETTTSATALSNAYIQSWATTTGGAGTASYTTSVTAAPYPAGSQVVVVPGPTSALLASAQPYEDRGGAAIISVNNIAGTVPISVGQAVLGTQYSGPVMVSAVISQASGSALFEVSFTPQSTSVSTTTGAGTLIQFIDPSPSGSLYPPLFTFNNLGFSGTYQQLQYEAWCSYLYLDGAEREYFASTPMDMIVTQVNRVPINPLSTHEVNLAHPVKFLAFVSNSYATAYATQATTGITASSYQFKTQLNGVDVGDSRSLFQWQDVPQYYHTPFGYKAAGGIAPVTIISYCLDTSKLQPTGTLNFSRLDSYRIITPSSSTLAQIAGGSTGYIYAMNYNILRIQKGMGSMLYSS